MDDRLHRIGAQSVAQGAPDQQAKGRQAKKKDERLAETDGGIRPEGELGGRRLVG
jgi:hypothetical protein